MTEVTVVTDKGSLLLHEWPVHVGLPSCPWPVLASLACWALGDSGALGSPQAPSASVPTLPLSPLFTCWVGGCRLWENGGLISEPVSQLEFVLNLIHIEIKRRLVGLRFPWQGTVASGTPASSPPPSLGSRLPMPGELGLLAGWPLGWSGLLAGGRAVRIHP